MSNGIVVCPAAGHRVLLLAIPLLAMGCRDQQSGRESSPVPHSTLSADEIFVRASPAVVQVVIQDRNNQPIAFGSGFLINTNGLIATNYHVIEKGHSAHVVLADGTIFSVVGVAAYDSGADLAILKVAGQIHAQPLELIGNELPLVGAKVYAIGNPLGLANTLSDGLVSGHQEIPIYPITMIQTTTPISPGSSGGPLVGDNGKVVGVMTVSRLGGQNLNFAVPASHVARLRLQCGSEKHLTQLPLIHQSVSAQPKMGHQTQPPESKYGFELRVRKAGEDKFDDKTQKFGIEVFLDPNNNKVVYISETGSIAVLPAASTLPSGKGNDPTWQHAMEVRVRRPGEIKFHN